MVDDRAKADTSGTYSVGRIPNRGQAVWWANWQMGAGPAGATDVRPATMEEHALMEMAIWHHANSSDLERLREMIK